MEVQRENAVDNVQSLLEDLVGSRAAEEQHLNDAKPKAFAWARVSTEKQEERGLSMPQQLREIHAYAERNGIEIVQEFQEAASAFNHVDKRVEFNRMIERAKSDPSVSIILVHEYSRFSRNFIQAMTLLTQLKNAGVDVVSVMEPSIDLDTTSGLFMGALTHASNEVTSRKISEHVRKGCTANIQTRDPESGLCYKNGGKALWGYKAQLLNRGIRKGGRAEYKLVWVLDDTAVAGKPLHKWARECLELAMNGASYADLRDFCNENGIPGRKDPYWSHHNWKDLLELKNLLQYAGFGVWNARSKTQRRTPPSEWVIVKDAQPAIITEEEAIRIYKVREEARKEAERRGFGRTRSSDYLLSGGLFKCDRCGKNMIGHGTRRGKHYVCGSQPYRKGMGCGTGVYIPQDYVESEVIKGMEELLCAILDHTDIVAKVNTELKQMWERKSGYDPTARKRLAEVEKQIDNVRSAILEGLRDVEWANGKLDELNNERDRLIRMIDSSPRASDPPQADLKLVRLHLSNLKRTLDQARIDERKRLVSGMVESVGLDPETRTVHVSYQLPDIFTDYVPDKFMNRGGTACRAPTRCGCPPQAESSELVEVS